MEIIGYAIEKKLGTGELATVYLATQMSTGQQVALKVMHENISQDARFRQAFSEYRTGFSTLRNPHYLSVYDCGVVNDQCYIAMQYFPNGPLSKKVLSLQQAKERLLDIIRRLAEVLEFLHGQGYVHHRIKPSNLFFDADDRLVLSEVEIARDIIFEQDIQHLAQPLNESLKYTTPEQLLGRRADNRSDFYCLGLAIYELLLGQLPYASEKQQVQRRLHIAGELPTVPVHYKKYQRLLDQLLAKNPQNRIATSKQFFNVARRSELLTSISYTDTLVAPEQQKSQGPMIISIAVLIAFVTGLLVLSGDEDDDASGQRNTTTDVPEEQPQDQKITPVYADFATEEEDDAKIDPNTIYALLQQAEKQFVAGRLLEPPGDNAYESYQSVLALMPNDDAETGLSKIANQFFQQALAEKEAGALEVAIKYIDQGRSRFPLNTGLLYLNESVKEELAKKQQARSANEVRKRKVARLIALSKQQLSARILTQPPGENAFATFQALAQLAPEEKWIERGSQQIVDIFTQMAAASLQQGRYQLGLNYVQSGLDILPADAALTALNKQLSAAYEQQLQASEQEKSLLARKQQEEEKNQKINALISLAEGQFKANKLTSPKGDNVLETFLAIKQIDPTNPIARTGFNRIADQYLALATKQLDTQNLAKSIEMLNKGLEILPLHAGLNAFRSELLDKQEKEKQRKKVRTEKDQAIQALLAQADQQFALNRLTSPTGNNVYETFQQILTISPKHPQVKKGFDRIADQYLALAQNKRAAREFKKSRAMVRKGLIVMPRHQGLLNFKQQLEAGIAGRAVTPAQKKTSTVQTLFSQADRQIAQERFFFPVGDSLLETYRQLQSVTKDARLQKIAQRITRQYKVQVKSLVKQDAWPDALQLVREASRFNPRDTEILSLRDQITGAIALQRKQQRQAQESLESQPVEKKEKKLRTFGTF